MPLPLRLCLPLILVFFLNLIHLSSCSLQIVPGATWTAAGTNEHVQAHGGGIIEVDSVFYWIGENKVNGSVFRSVDCYSSNDLVQWNFTNSLLTLQPSGDLGPNRVIERPHVLYNEATALYVMWMHVDNSSYGEARAGVATCATVCGDYEYQGGSQPLEFQSRDENVFQDTDGTGYLLTEDRLNGLRIDKLSSDYLTVEEATYLYAEDYEAPAMYKSGDTYFMFASHESGWDPNDNIYSTATNISGPWSDWQLFAPNRTKTFSSQTADVVAVNGLVMYMGDRWNSSNLMASTYVWLPLNISGTSVSMSDEVNWIPDLTTGTWEPGPSETAIEAEADSNTLTNGAAVVSCAGCSGSEYVGFIGGPPGGALTLANISSTVDTTTTIRIQYTNGDQTQRYASVVVNGLSYVVAFLPTADGVSTGVSTVNVLLKSGSVNEIQFEGYNGGWGPNIDKVYIPVN